MEVYKNHESVAALMNRENVDTGFGVHLFHDWRYNADGSDDLRFELNKPAFRGAKILVTGDNFGCGSSREHAPWAIADYGFNTIISTSFADIFYNNCFKNCILPLIVDSAKLQDLMSEIAANEGVEFTVDLVNQRVTTPAENGFEFEIEAYRKENMLKGLDDIAVSLKHEDKISAFEEKQKQAFPWLWRAA
jgi:3-isopropylmalate/(R)-2-methylmalate dehydratase small subunit